MDISKKLVRMKVYDLIPYENNPRKIPEEAVADLCESYRQCGVIDPIEIDEDNVILAGHTRRLAALEMEIDKVDCLRVSGLTDEQKRKYRILANKTGERSGWDYDLLAEELDELDFGDYDFGWDFPEEENGLIEKEAEEDDYEVEIPEEPKTNQGQIYKLGVHRLMCGSSTDPEQVKKLVQDSNQVDLLLTDTPYGVDYSSSIGMKIENDNLAGEEFLKFLQDAFDAADQVMKPGAVFYIWHAENGGAVFRNAIINVGWKLRQCLIWVKNGFVIGRQDYQWRHEPCLYGWKDGAAHYFTNDRTQSTVFDDKVDLKKLKKEEMLQLLQEIFSEKTPTTILYEDKPMRNYVHPTMKPVRLMGKLVANSTRAGETVLDLFGGSGSTLIACEQLNRSCCTMELDPKYCDVIIDRWEQFTGEKAVLLNG